MLRGLDGRRAVGGGNSCRQCFLLELDGFFLQKSGLVAEKVESLESSYPSQQMIEIPFAKVVLLKGPKLLRRKFSKIP